MASGSVHEISDEALNSTWSDSDLTRLSRHIVDWETVAPVLSITEAEEREIKGDHPHDYQMQKYAMLRTWKSKTQDGATYRQLTRIFRSIRELGLVEQVHDILLHPEVSATVSNVLACYQEFLRRSYCKIPHPSLLPDQWPVMKKPVFVCLTLIKNHFIDGEIKQIPIADLFVKSKRQLGSENHQVVITGLPGSGKTTLTWHVSQLWAKKLLFQEFSLFLTIPLRSLQVQQATCLADIIPHPDKEQRKAIAQAVSSNHGDGICFWFDGWDEMPQGVQTESFIASFIHQAAPETSLPGCTIVVTTRTEAYRLKSSESALVHIDCLDRKQVKELIIKNIEGTGHDANELLATLESKSVLRRFCSLPITVTILIHLFFTFGTNIPTTQTELFQCLVLNLLLRNLQTRWLLNVKTLASFDCLPEFAHKCFDNLCKLAYDAVTNNKTVFHPSDIPNIQLPLPLATLGLMKINPHVEWFGINEELTFIHPTVQEFLAAFYLASIPPCKHYSCLHELIESDHSPVVVFYGGLTKFKDTKEFLPNRNFYAVCKKDDMFFTLVESLYESRDPSLCQIVNKCMIWTDCSVSISLSLMLESLTPAQMVPLGYFIVHLCSTTKTCRLDLVNGHFSEGAVESFVKIILLEWAKLNPKPNRSNLELIISEDHISQVTVPICQLIEHTDLLISLKLCIHLSSFVFYRIETGLKHTRCSPRLSLHSVMRPLISVLSKTSSLKRLCLKFQFPTEYEIPIYSLIAYSEYYIVLLLTCCQGIRTLTLQEFFQMGHIYYLSSVAIACNKRLRHLGLDENFPLKLYEPNFELLTLGIGLHTFMKKLSVVGSVCDDTLLHLLKMVYKYNTPLNVVLIDIPLSPKVRSMLNLINEKRSQSSNKPLVLKNVGSNNYSPHAIDSLINPLPFPFPFL